jgi:hypothetical protein
MPLILQAMLMLTSSLVLGKIQERRILKKVREGELEADTFFLKKDRPIEPPRKNVPIKLRKTKMVQHIKKVSKLGYRIDSEGNIVSPRGNVLKGRDHRQANAASGRRGNYKRFTVRLQPSRETVTVYVHQLQGFQKFGDIALSEGIEVRHANNNSLDNRADNILVGTKSDQMLDFDPKVRVARARNAALAKRRWSDDDVRRLRKRRQQGASMTELAKEEGVGKSVMSMMLNGKTYQGVEGLEVVLEDFDGRAFDHLSTSRALMQSMRGLMGELRQDVKAGDCNGAFSKAQLLDRGLGGLGREMMWVADSPAGTIFLIDDETEITREEALEASGEIVGEVADAMESISERCEVIPIGGDMPDPFEPPTGGRFVN